QTSRTCPPPRTQCPCPYLRPWEPGGVMSSSSSHERSPRAQVDIDLDAIRHNLTLLGARAPGAEVMAVVKADAYGHGALPVARAAVEAGASWLGTCSLGEALALREAGITTRLFSWLDTPDVDFAAG